MDEMFQLPVAYPSRKSWTFSTFKASCFVFNILFGKAVHMRTFLTFSCSNFAEKQFKALVKDRLWSKQSIGACDRNAVALPYLWWKLSFTSNVIISLHWLVVKFLLRKTLCVLHAWSKELASKPFKSNSSTVAMWDSFCTQKAIEGRNFESFV